MANEVLHGLIRANLAASVAALLILALRGRLRPLIGPGAVYALWLAVPAAGLASLLPARTIVVVLRAAVLNTAATAGPKAVAAQSWFAPHGDVALLTLWGAGAGLALAWLALWQYHGLRGLDPQAKGAQIDQAPRAEVGPAVVGVLAPRIVLPADFETRFTPRERDVILAHEGVHLARGDSRINAVAAWLQCLNWFNPLVHLAARAMRLDQELSCDAMVMARHPKARRSYAEALLKSQADVTVMPIGCSWQAKGQPALARRLTLLAAAPLPRHRLAGGLVLAGALTIGAGLAGWSAQPARQKLIIETQPQLSAAVLPASVDAEMAPPDRVATAPSPRSHPEPRAAVAPAVQLASVAPRTDPLGILQDGPSMPFGAVNMEPEDMDAFYGSMPPEVRIADQPVQGPVWSSAYRGGAYHLKSDMKPMGSTVLVSAQLYQDGEMVGSGTALVASSDETAYIALSNGQMGVVTPGKGAYVFSPQKGGPRAI